MIVKINGKSETFDNGLNLTELISGKGLVPDHIVVEHNLQIISKDEWAGITLKENDSVEIVSFVGGG